MGLNPDTAQFLVDKTMKLLALSLLPWLAQAEWSQMEEDFKLLAENYTMVHGYRGFTGIVATALDPINGYGCWCYFQQFAGKGTPVNEVDQICKVLQQGYECAFIDGEEDAAEPTCIAFEIEYTSGITVGTETVEVECANRNSSNNCA